MRLLAMRFLLAGISLGHFLLTKGEVFVGDYWKVASTPLIPLAFNQSEEVFKEEMRHCAFCASTREWADVFCYLEGRCLLYQLMVNDKDSVLPPVSTCWFKKGLDTCYFPFLDVPGVGCLYFHPAKMTWTAARSFCQVLGHGLSDLVIPDYYDAFLNWFHAVDLVQAWVGANDTHWYDGTPHQIQGFDPGKCIRTKKGPELEDRNCDETNYFLCELTVP